MLSVVVVLILPVIDVTSVVVSFKSLVVGGGVIVESVALNPFSLERSGAAKERGMRNKAIIIIVIL